MGFPAGYYAQKLLPKILFSPFSLLSLLATFILTLLRFLGLSYILEPQIWPEPGPEPRPDSASIIQEMLPIVKFADIVCAPGSNPPPVQCAVCLYEFRNHEEIRQLNCRHVFHRVCVDRWMDHDQITCPLCRTPFVPDELMETFHEKLGAAATSAIPEFGGEYSVINSFL